MKKVKGIRRKIIEVVFVTVSAAVLLIFLGTLYYYTSYHKELCINTVQEDMQRIVSEVDFLQSLIDNVSKQVVADRVVRESLECSKDQLGTYLYKRLRANEALAGYAHVVDPIQEVLILSKNGESYSSLYTMRSSFKPEENDWYVDFKKRNVRTGFSKEHNSLSLKSGVGEDVISYVMTFYGIDNIRTEQGDLIINVKTEALRDMFSNCTSLVSGAALFDGQNDIIYSDGEFSFDNRIIAEGKESGFNECDNGNIIITNSQLGDGWFVVMELSRSAMFEEMKLQIIYLTLAFLAIGTILIIAVSEYIKKIVDPINNLTASVVAVSDGDFDAFVEINTNDELEVLANGFNHMLSAIKRYMKESVENEKLKRHMQVDKLMNQINPHFIYNTLNSIVYMAQINGNKDIVKFTNAFITLLQGTLRVQDSIYIPIKEELDNIEHYLEIQQYRYTDKFDVIRDYDENAMSALVPAVMLEPIIENAIFHGLAPKEEKGTLKLIIRKEGKNLNIRIEDDGIGMSKERIEKLLSDTENERGAIHKIGFANVRKRIKEIFGEEYDLNVSSAENAGTCVSAIIPFVTEDNKES